MHVVLFSPDTIHKAPGGIGRVLGFLIARLQQKGFEFTVVLPNRKIRNSHGHMRVNDMPVREISIRTFKMEAGGYEKSNTVLHLNFPLLHPDLVLGCRSEIPQISTFHTSVRGELESLRHVPSGWLNSSDWGFVATSPFQHLTERRAEHSSAVVGVSSTLVREVESSHRSASRWMWTIIRNGVDTEFFRPQPRRNEDDRPIILFSGRHTARKGMFDLLSVFKLIRRHRSRPILVITGRPSLLTRRMFRQVATMHLTEDIIFAGFVSQEALASLYAQATVLLFPSRYEGCPMSILEAMSTGCPVIGYRIPSLQEIFNDGEGGILVESYDSVALARAAEELLDSDSLRNHLGSVARGLAQEVFSLDTFADRYQRLYENAFINH